MCVLGRWVRGEGINLFIELLFCNPKSFLFQVRKFCNWKLKCFLTHTSNLACRLSLSSFFQNFLSFGSISPAFMRSSKIGKYRGEYTCRAKMMCWIYFEKIQYDILEKFCYFLLFMVCNKIVRQDLTFCAFCQLPYVSFTV